MAAETPARTHLSSIDSAWYRMESASNHANIGALLLFDEPLDFERVRELVARRLVDAFDHFHQRVVESTGRLARPYWEDDPDFSIDRHVHHETLGGAASLRERAGELMSEGLDLERPLWQLHQIDGVDGGSAILAQLHHCLGDGFALARVLLTLTDEPFGAQGDTESEQRRAAAHRPLGRRLLDELQRRLADGNPTSGIAEDIGEIADELGHLGSMASDPETRLKRPLTGRLSVAWSPRWSLSSLKELAHAHDATLNDVLMVAVAGALRSHLADEVRGDANLRAIVPVNLRPAHAIEEMEAVLGNEFGLVFVDLPTHLAGVQERLAAVRSTIGELKQSPEAVVMFGVLTIGGSATAPVEEVVQRYFSDKASLVVSNVPGPAAPIRIAGRRLKDLLFWVPHPGPRLGLGISLISYAGQVRIGVRADAAVADDAAEIVDRIEEALAELRASA